MAFKVREPVPYLVKEPEVVVIVPSTLIFPIVVNVTPRAEVALMALAALRVSVPASFLIVAAEEAIVIVPLQVLLPLIFCRIVPLSVSGFATVISPCSCNVPPATLTDEELLNAVLFCMFKIPALIVVTPV